MVSEQFHPLTGNHCRHHCQTNHKSEINQHLRQIKSSPSSKPSASLLSLTAN
ncbi:hypothetical protein LguiA_033080 [Lonicera macranthoides]